MKLLKYIFVLTIAFCVLLSISTLLWQQHSMVNASHTYLHTHFLFFSLIRLFMIGLVIAFWPTSIRWLSRHQQWSDEWTQTLLTRRWVLLGFFIAMESLFFLNHY